MNELDHLLEEIDKTCNENLDRDLKIYILNNLWNLYKSKKDNVSEESYIIDQNPMIKKINIDLLNKAIKELNTSDRGISLEDATTILDWVVYNARTNLINLSVNINNNSLDGYCELSQLLTLYPLEQLGLDITKNTAIDSFNYPYNHAFGSVKFLINENGISEYKYFLIDVTYRQFFIKDRCSKIHFYLDDMLAPAPGYFVNDYEFAKSLMKDGFIELTNITAKKYGEPFAKSGLSDININYFESIIDKNNDYVLSASDLEGLNVNLPK